MNAQLKQLLEKLQRQIETSDASPLRRQDMLATLASIQELLEKVPAVPTLEIIDQAANPPIENLL